MSEFEQIVELAAKARDFYPKDKCSVEGVCRKDAPIYVWGTNRTCDFILKYHGSGFVDYDPGVRLWRYITKREEWQNDD